MARRCAGDLGQVLIDVDDNARSGDAGDGDTWSGDAWSGDAAGLESFGRGAWLRAPLTVAHHCEVRNSVGW